MLDSINIIELNGFDIVNPVLIFLIILNLPFRFHFENIV